jgi:DNA-binding NtrC family response regulator
MPTRKRRAGAQRVAIISANPETIDGLQSYLESAGMATRGTRQLEDCGELTAPSTVAVVLFPDDFPPARVLETIAKVDAQRPSVLCMLVTSQPQTFEALASGRRSLLVVPRPAWGWTILDAIRAHVDDGPPPSSSRA